MKISIREALPSDLEFIESCQMSLALESENMKLDRTILRGGIERLFRDPVKGKYYLAVKDGKSVGTFLLTREWSDWRNGEVGWIHSVYVLPESRKDGVFRSMYESLQARVGRDRELIGIRLYVDQRNERAKAVYERLGMDGSHYQLYEWLG